MDWKPEFQHNKKHEEQFIACINKLFYNFLKSEDVIVEDFCGKFKINLPYEKKYQKFSKFLSKCDGHRLIDIVRITKNYKSAWEEIVVEGEI